MLASVASGSERVAPLDAQHLATYLKVKNSIRGKDAELDRFLERPGNHPKGDS